MPIGNIKSKVSSRDIDRIRDKRNPPEFEPGFEPDDAIDEFSDLFDDLESLDMGGERKPITASEIFGIKKGENEGGTGSPLGTLKVLLKSLRQSIRQSIGSPWQSLVNQAPRRVPSTFDKAIDKSGEH